MKAATKELLKAFVKNASYIHGSKGGSSYRSQFSYEKLVFFAKENNFQHLAGELKSLCSCAKGRWVLKNQLFDTVSCI